MTTLLFVNKQMASNDSKVVFSHSVYTHKENKTLQLKLVMYNQIIRSFYTYFPWLSFTRYFTNQCKHK